MTPFNFVKWQSQQASDAVPVQYPYFNQSKCMVVPMSYATFLQIIIFSIFCGLVKKIDFLFLASNYFITENNYTKQLKQTCFFFLFCCVGNNSLR